MERRERANLEIDVTNFLKDQRYRVHPRTQDSHEEAVETGDQSNQENPSDVEFEYVTCHENFKNKKNNDTETPKLVNYSDDHDPARYMWNKKRSSMKQSPTGQLKLKKKANKKTSRKLRRGGSFLKRRKGTPQAVAKKTSTELHREGSFSRKRSEAPQ